MNPFRSKKRSATCCAITWPWKSMNIFALGHIIHEFYSLVYNLPQYMHLFKRFELLPWPPLSAELMRKWSFFMKSLLVSLSLLSIKLSNFSIVMLLAMLLIKFWFRQFISIGKRTTSWMFSVTKSMHSCTRSFIWRKSLEMRMEITFFMSKRGVVSSCVYN